ATSKRNEAVVFANIASSFTCYSLRYSPPQSRRDEIFIEPRSRIFAQRCRSRMWSNDLSGLSGRTLRSYRAANVSCVNGYKHFAALRLLGAGFCESGRVRQAPQILTFGEFTARASCAAADR